MESRKRNSITTYFNVQNVMFATHGIEITSKVTLRDIESVSDSSKGSIKCDSHLDNFSAKCHRVLLRIGVVSEILEFILLSKREDLTAPLTNSRESSKICCCRLDALPKRKVHGDVGG